MDLRLAGCGDVLPDVWLFPVLQGKNRGDRASLCIKKVAASGTIHYCPDHSRLYCSRFWHHAVSAVRQHLQLSAAFRLEYPSLRSWCNHPVCSLVCKCPVLCICNLFLYFQSIRSWQGSSGNRYHYLYLLLHVFKTCIYRRAFHLPYGKRFYLHRFWHPALWGMENIYRRQKARDTDKGTSWG